MTFEAFHYFYTFHHQLKLDDTRLAYGTHPPMRWPVVYIPVTYPCLPRPGPAFSMFGINFEISSGKQARS